MSSTDVPTGCDYGLFFQDCNQFTSVQLVTGVRNAILRPADRAERGLEVIMTKRILCLIGAMVAAMAILATAQTPKEFDVAAIKLNTDGGEAWSIRTPPGGRLTARNITVRKLLLESLGTRDFQLEGTPKWVDGERYDITAKADMNGEITPEELRPMMRALLESRFGLALHHETREAPVYSLVAARNGAKLRPNSGTPGHSTDWGKDHINATDVTLTELAGLLAVQLDRIVVDNTEIQGNFDFKLTWTPTQATDLTGPSIFTAIQEQYGLRLVSTRGPMDVTVIDRLQRPTGN